MENKIIEMIKKTPNVSKYYEQPYPNTKYKLEMIVADIIYVLKTGVSWRDVRTKCNHCTLYYHYKRFVEHDIFGKVFRLLRKEYLEDLKAENMLLLIDSTVVNNKFGVTKIGRNKYYKNKRCIKISMMTDGNGIPLSILMMKGNKHDNTTFGRHIDDAIILCRRKKKLKVLADKGYCSKKNYELLDSKKIEHIIPPRRNMKLYETYKYSKTEYVKRNKIENTFARIKKLRRLDNRYDKKMKSMWGFVYMGCSVMVIEHMMRIK